MKVGQDPAKKTPSGMSKTAKEKHNTYQREYTATHKAEKKAANKRYWESKGKSKSGCKD